MDEEQNSPFARDLKAVARQQPQTFVLMVSYREVALRIHRTSQHLVDVVDRGESENAPGRDEGRLTC